jgi:apolipoprotein D and lipocalin family protein
MRYKPDAHAGLGRQAMKIAIAMMLCLVSGAAAAVGTAAAADAVKAPQPAKPVDAGFWSGRWYEVGRTPKDFNKDCVAGTTDFVTRDGGPYEADACHDKTPDGKEEDIGGAMKILNPGQNTKITVTYHLAFIPIHVENWVLDHGDDWMILGTPDLSEVHIYTRDAHPPQPLVDRLAKEIRDVGYTGELQMPPQTKP